MMLQRQYECGYCSAVYVIVLCVCGWRAIYRVVTRTRGEYRPYDALLWLSAAVLVLVPIVADVTNAVGWSDPDILYPTILSVGGIMGLLTWDVWTVWSMARRAVSDGG